MHKAQMCIDAAAKRVVRTFAGHVCPFARESLADWFGGAQQLECLWTCWLVNGFSAARW
jgi:hypothetical protein